MILDYKIIFVSSQLESLTHLLSCSALYYPILTWKATASDKSHHTTFPIPHPIFPLPLNIFLLPDQIQKHIPDPVLPETPHIPYSLCL